MRTALYFCVGIFSTLIWHAGVFAQDVKTRINQLSLRTSTSPSMICEVPTSSGLAYFAPPHHYSQCARFFGAPNPKRFTFSKKREDFSLQHIRNVSSLVRQGGGRLFQVGNTIPLFSDTLAAKIKMVYRDSFLITNSNHSSPTQLGTQFVLKGSMKQMMYRAEYGYAGHNMDNTLSLPSQDQIGGKIQWEWELPFITPKVELSRFSTNVAQNPTRNQTVSTRQHYSLNWTIPDWPNFTLTYDQEQKDLFGQSEETSSDSTLMEKVSTQITIDRPIGKGELKSHYATFQNDIHDQGDLETFHSTLKGTLRFFQPIDISPSLGFTQQSNRKQDFSQVDLFAKIRSVIHLSTEQTLHPGLEWTRIISRTAGTFSDSLYSKLQYSYHDPAHGNLLSIIGQYAIKQHSQLISNPQTYEISLFVRKDLHSLLGLPHQQQFLSFKFTQNHQIISSSFQPQRRQTTAMLLFSAIP